MKKSRKILLLVITVMTIIMAMTVTSFADSGSDDWSVGNYKGFEYEIYEEEASIIYYTGSATKIIIPSKIEGYPVDYIGQGAFQNCTSITSIILPSTITAIGHAAFEGCTNLKSITIPDSVTLIGVGAFENTAYYNDENNWENGALYIDNHLIDVNSNLPSDYTVKSGTITIADSSFKGCDLVTVTIPDSVVKIGGGALDRNGTCFMFSDKLTAINVSSNNKYYSSKDGVLFNKDKTMLLQYPLGKAATEYIILDTVKTIGGSAFENCKSLICVAIPASVSYIDWHAFRILDEDWNRVYIPIKGYTGTYAETYANENGHEFISLCSIPKDKTGLYKVGNTWCYVKDGKVDYNFNNLAKYNGKWYYVEDGIKNASFTGLYKYSGKWYYVKSGAVNTSYTGLVKHTDGKWYYVKNGVKTSFNGLVKYNGKWYHVKDGVKTTYTGLVKHTDGKYYYVKSGVKTSFNGLVKYNSKWYYVKSGVVNTSYTGLVKHTDGKWYYVKKGVKTSYTGNVKYNGKTYKVVKGVKV